MKVIDMHCDTISEIHRFREQGGEESLLENNRMIDLRKLRAGDYLVQNFALHPNLRDVKGRPFEYCMRLADTFFGEMEHFQNQIRQVFNAEDIERNRKEGKISALLTIEEGEACQGELAFLRDFYRIGVRMMTFTWNYPNSLANPNQLWKDAQGKSHACPDTEHGLTERGFEFLEEMERLGMIVDISHLGDRGIEDVLSHAKRPLVASHSNSRAVASHPRNLTDSMIRRLSEGGGVMGINFYGPFLKDQDGEMPVSRMEDMIAHMKHIRQVGGIQCIGLGSDFDGIFGDLELSDASCLPRLAQEMERQGFTIGEIEDVFYKNVLRVYREVL